MKRLPLLALALFAFTGCTDNPMNDATTSTTRDDADRYEVSKPVVEHPVVDQTADPTMPADPGVTQAVPEGPALPTDEPVSAPDSDLATPATSAPAIEIDSEPAINNDAAENENQASEDLSANIRDEIDAADLSTPADDVQVEAADGKVTLSGTVDSQEEKDRIGEIASDAAGEDNVENNLEVKAAE